MQEATPITTQTRTTHATATTPFALYERLRGTVGTADCARWREAIFQRHWPIMALLVNHYEHLANTADYVAANQWLRVINQRLALGRTGLWLHSDRQVLEDYLQAKARQLRQEVFELTHTLGSAALMLAAIKAKVERTGVAFPALPEHPSKHQKAGAIARVIDPDWWRKQLRVKQWREMEALLRELGKTAKHTGIYVSDLSYQRRTEQKDRGHKLLQALQAENELGQTYSLAELAELSTSNPVNRRHELMTRLRGFEEVAQQASEPWQGVLFTVTCPSKYHAVMARSGQPNPRFNGTTPSQANAYLNTLWQRTRAAWQSAGVEVFGFRVAEPHHDGTPHWHVLLFIRPAQIAQAEAIFKRYAMAEDTDEPGAQAQRFNTVIIDPTKGSATGYIAKYIAKNIDGFAVETDHYGKDAVSSALRIEAWASLWGIRQFQQIGGPSVTVWRELRRLEAEQVDETLLQQLTAAADDGDWQTYTTLMGGAVCPRVERPVRPYVITRTTLSKYAEQIKVIKGIWFGPTTITTRLHEWVINLVRTPAANDEAMAAIHERGAACSQAPPGAPLEFCQ